MANEMGTCRSCEAPIRWALNSGSGKGNPLDVDPVAVMYLCDEHARYPEGAYR